MMSDAQSKKMLETLFGDGLNFCRANRLSKIRPSSGSAPGWIVMAAHVNDCITSRAIEAYEESILHKGC